MSTFQNSHYSSLSFPKEWQTYFDTGSCYLQKFATGEEIRIQYTSDIDAFEAKLISETGAESIIPVSHIYYSEPLYQLEVTFDIAQAGRYELLILSGSTVVAGTKFLVLEKSDLFDTVLLSYTHRKNEYDTIFDGRVFNFRVEGGINPGESTQAVSNEIFRDQRFDPHQTESVAYEIRTLTIGNTLGVPQWIGNKVNHIFDLSDVTVDRVPTTRNEGSVPEQTSLGEYNPLKVHKIKIEQSDKEIFEFNSNIEYPTTEIEFQVTTTQTNQTVYVFSAASTSGNGRLTAIWDMDAGQIENLTIPQAIIANGPSGVTYPDCVKQYHTYANPGTYTVKITTYPEVNWIHFADLYWTNPNESYPLANSRTVITGFFKFQSSSLANLNYLFAGLAGFEFSPDFVIEAPKATTMNGIFLNCAAIKRHTPSHFSQIKLITNMYWTFRQSGLDAIEEGAWDTLTEVRQMVDTLRASRSLGFGHTSNDYLPMSLLRTMTKLYRVEGLLNYCENMYGGTYKIKMTKEFFRNNPITNMRYFMYKVNRFALEKDFLHYIADTVEDMEGAFSEPNQISSGFGWTAYDPDYTVDLQQIFVKDTYPNIKNLRIAFNTARGNDNQLYGFNKNETLGGDPTAPSYIKLDAETFIAKFPNIHISTGENDPDGREGALAYMSTNSINYDSIDPIWITMP